MSFLLIGSFIRFAAGILCVAIPVQLGYWLKLTLPSTRKWFVVGAVAFFLSQVFHVPFNTFLLTPVCQRWIGLDVSQDQGAKLALSAFLLGLSAGVFEESARWIVFRHCIMTPQNRTYNTAVMIGAGHGGCESIIVGLVEVVALVAMVVLYVNRDNLTKIGVPSTNVDETLQQLQAYWSMPWYIVMTVPLQRIMAILFHQSASVLVWQCAVHRHWIWYGAAVLFHTALDMMAVFVSVTWKDDVVVRALAVTGIMIVTSLPLSLYILWYFRMESSNDYETPVEFRAVSQNEDGVDDAGEDSIPSVA